MRSLIIAVALIVVGCDAPAYQCSEQACKPGDIYSRCVCDYYQHMERQPDGVIICRCPTDAGQ